MKNNFELLMSVKWYFEIKNLSLKKILEIKAPISIEEQNELRLYCSQYFTSLLSATELLKDKGENVVIYDDGELELNVSVENETVWLNQSQLCKLFGRNKSVISRHIRNIFTDSELERSSTVAKNATVQFENKREVLREIEYYNLDVIISVGYRVKSQKGVRFRQWSTSILKSYIQNGYIINGDKITNERFVFLENEVSLLKSKVESISNAFEDKTLHQKQGIFFDGQIYDT